MSAAYYVAKERRKYTQKRKTKTKNHCVFVNNCTFAQQKHKNKDMKESYTIKMRCATCGCDNYFIFNEDKSFVKCTNCNREYFGGIEELKELNAEAFDEVKEQINKEVLSYIPIVR